MHALTHEHTRKNDEKWVYTFIKHKYHKPSFVTGRMYIYRETATCTVRNLQDIHQFLAYFSIAIETESTPLKANFNSVITCKRGTST